MRSRLQFTGEGSPRESIYRVLLLEDNPGDAELTRERLSGVPGHQFDVTLVTTLAAGLEALAAEVTPFDVVVVDLDLPDSVGLDTLTRVRTVADDLPVVVFSGRSDRALHDQLLSAGADDVLHKDEPASRLLARAVLYSLERIRADARRKRMEQLVLESPDGVLVTDKSGRVLFANQAAQELFGRPESALIGESLGFDFEDGRTFEIDIERGSEHRAAEVRVVDCQWQQTDGFLATIRDITERNRMAEVLRHRQKLEAIGQLAGGVAHDFNNLLTVIMSRVDFAMDALEPTSDAYAQIDGIRLASQRAAALTRQLLTFARRQSGEAAVIDLNDVVQNMQHMLGRLIGEHIEVDVSLDPKLPHVLVDPDQIGQALTNLSLNARDAMPAGGRLRVTTDAVELAESAASEMGLPVGVCVRLTIADTGHGIRPDIRERIFEPFFTTKEERGTGLGLSMVHGIVTQAGGHIRVESTPGQGATFEIFLPTALAGAPQVFEEGRSDVLTGNERILLVEDEPEVRDVATSMLKKFGYQVVSASDGASALEIWRRAPEPFHLVLTDIVMPGMSGWELGQRLRELGPWQRILFMSGYSDEVLADHGVRESSIALLPKPFTSNELARAVRRSINGHERH